MRTRWCEPLALAFCRSGRSRMRLRDLSSGGRLGKWPFQIVVWPGVDRRHYVAVSLVITRDITGLLGAHLFVFKLCNHPLLDHLAAPGVDRVSNISVKTSAAFCVTRYWLGLKMQPALIAERGTQMVFTAAARAMGHQFAAGHGHKRPVSALNNF